MTLRARAPKETAGTMHTRGRKTLPKVDRDARRVDKKRGKGRSRYVFFLWEAERREQRSGKQKEDAWNGKLQKEVFIEAVAEKPDPPCVPEQVEKRDEHKRRFEIEKEEREREENGRGPKPRYCPDNLREKGGEEKEGEHENVFG